LQRRHPALALPEGLKRIAEIVLRRVRFFAWINRNRRLAKDFEATVASARGFLYAASVMLLVRRIAKYA